MKDTVKVFAPASISNIGCGFDTLGFPINNLGDEVVLRKNSTGEIRIEKITGANGIIPLDARKNTAGAALHSMQSALNLSFGVDVEINKKMPVSSGLGSSAASAVAAVTALNELLEKPLPRRKLLKFALDGEFIASNSFHADNVAPSLLGGIILIRDYDPIDLIKIPAPEFLFCVVIYQDVEINTNDARDILPKSLEMKQARKHFGNIGALISGFYESDYERIGSAIQDEIAEPVRAKLIPNYFNIKDAAISAGAFGCNISGSGPTIFAFANSKNHAEEIAGEMKKAAPYSQSYISKINPDGAVVTG